MRNRYWEVTRERERKNISTSKPRGPASCAPRRGSRIIRALQQHSSAVRTCSQCDLRSTPGRAGVCGAPNVAVWGWFALSWAMLVSWFGLVSSSESLKSQYMHGVDDLGQRSQLAKLSLHLLAACKLKLVANLNMQYVNSKLKHAICLASVTSTKYTGWMDNYSHTKVDFRSLNGKSIRSLNDKSIGN